MTTALRTPLTRNAARGVDLRMLYSHAGTWARGAHWWERLAAELIADGRHWTYGTRRPGGLYFTRMWISPPRLVEKRANETSGPFDSANSALLHFFWRGDDDQALHNHPWSFKTQILSGGYAEHLPPASWSPVLPLGPAWNDYIVIRRAGDVVMHQSGELHCVGRVEPGTFTLVQTGPEDREWGFHPPGKPFMTSKVFLDPSRIETERITKASA